VLEDGAAQHVREVQALEVLVGRLQHVHDAQRLAVVVEGHARAFVQDALALVAEGRVADVVHQRQRLAQRLVQAQREAQEARQLRDLERVRQARAVEVALVDDEDLRLVLEPPEGARVHDAVAVAREAGAEGVGRLGEGARR
jgi:hypothetical protein